MVTQGPHVGSCSRCCDQARGEEKKFLYIIYYIKFMGVHWGSGTVTVMLSSGYVAVLSLVSVSCCHQVMLLCCVLFLCHAVIRLCWCVESCICVMLSSGYVDFHIYLCDDVIRLCCHVIIALV